MKNTLLLLILIAASGCAHKVKKAPKGNCDFSNYKEQQEGFEDRTK